MPTENMSKRIYIDDYVCSSSHFNDLSLTDVVLSENVLEIEKNAFYECSNLRHVNLGGVIKLGDFSFNRCYSLSALDGFEKV